MPKGESVCEFEQLVLLAVLRLGGDAYGMRVRQEIAQRTGRDAAIGAVYATLDRLAEKGLGAVRRGRGDAGARRARQALLQRDRRRCSGIKPRAERLRQHDGRGGFSAMCWRC